MAETAEANKTLVLARALIERTGTNLFLTGKAGTGKTTFLRELRETSRKRIVVVAPTGIAAINAGGVTIHSFFQLDFNIIPQSDKRHRYDKFSKDKLSMIRSLDLLVIDEISMVRADLLDRVDEVLRRHRNPRRPFGGVQLLMIGDLLQLPPVVTEDEAESLKEKYNSPYFFESEALKQAGFVTIELTKVYRQKDEHFISLLNAIRTNRIGDSELSELNACVGKKFEQSDKPVRLVTHNYQARNVNESELSRIPGSAVVFEASIDGKFPENSIPGERILELKKGAQVMFIKNDLVNHDWYNGLLGEVIDVSEKFIKVLTSEGREIAVRKEEWVNNSYTFDEEKGEIVEIREGSFHQYPLRLAWAITIHKSQGLTFDRAVIDATNAFAHGQTYVALSRCRSLEGLSLENPLSPSSVITDYAVEEFLTRTAQLEISEDEVIRLEREYILSLLKELFDFSGMDSSLNDLVRFVGRLPLQYHSLIEETVELTGSFKHEFGEVSRKLETWFPHYLLRTPGVDAEAKIMSGAGYFADKLDSVSHLLSKLPQDIENKEVERRLVLSTNELKNMLSVKQGLLREFASIPFEPETYLRLKSKLLVQTEKTIRKSVKKSVSGSAELNVSLNPDLERMIKTWRKNVSHAQGLPLFRIMSNNAIRSVANGIPDNMEQLKSLRNIGEYITSQFGDELLEIVKKWKEKSMK